MSFAAPLLLLLSAQADPPHIFGIHDPGGESHMAEKGKKGWILFTEEVGRNPADTSGRDYRPWSGQGFGVIVRINNGYGSSGTIPYAKHHDDFARRVANFVAASPGARIWIIGNEMNWDQETPAYEGVAEAITPTRYASCFLKCRSMIKALPGHAGDQVIPGASGTYGLFLGSQDWVSYHLEVLERIGQGNVDGIAIHTYTHGSSPGFISDESRFQDARVSHLHWNFRAYRDYLNAHPAWARALPVYITETDQNDPWLDQNNGWVQAAYREIHEWNQAAGTQKIRALCLYRWQQKDQWVISTKWGVINDFRDAMNNDYRWPQTGTVPPPPGQPDVVVTALSYTSGIFSCTVRNQGAISTPPGAAIGVAYRVDGIQRTWGSVAGPLAAGASVTIGTQGGSYTVPDGTHAIEAVADDINRFAESNESNNALSQTITVGAVGRPDVVVTSLSYANGTFTCTVKNQGSAASPSGVSVGVAYRVDGVQRTWGSVAGPLAAGASVTIGTQGGAFVIGTGTHAIEAVADDINRFAESNESNNALSRTITVGGPALPDVVVTSLSYSGGLFSCTVRNQGTASTPAGVSVGVAYFVDGAYRTWGAVAGPLASGASVTIGTQGGSYVLPAGSRTVLAFADDVNRFAESDEGNNQHSRTFNTAVAGVETVVAGDDSGGGGSCGALGLEALLCLLLRRRRSC
jgi:hypothetical protein